MTARFGDLDRRRQSRQAAAHYDNFGISHQLSSKGALVPKNVTKQSSEGAGTSDATSRVPLPLASLSLDRCPCCAMPGQAVLRKPSPSLVRLPQTTTRSPRTPFPICAAHVRPGLCPTLHKTAISHMRSATTRKRSRPRKRRASRDLPTPAALFRKQRPDTRADEFR